MNGDGWLDLVIADRDDNAVAVLLGVREVVGVPPAAAPRRVWLSAARPNPARAGVDVAFELPHPAAARLCVLDLSGRTVKILTEGALPAGRHEAHWDRTALDGRPVSAGVYWVQLRAPGARVATRVVVLN